MLFMHNADTIIVSQDLILARAIQQAVNANLTHWALAHAGESLAETAGQLVPHYDRQPTTLNGQLDDMFED